MRFEIWSQDKEKGLSWTRKIIHIFLYCVSLCVWETARGCFSALSLFFPFFRGRLVRMGGRRGRRTNLQKWASSFSFPSWLSAPQNTNIFFAPTKTETASSCFPRGPMTKTKPKYILFIGATNTWKFLTPSSADRIENKFHTCFTFWPCVESPLLLYGRHWMCPSGKEKFRETLLSLRRTCSPVCICFSLSHPLCPKSSKENRLYVLTKYTFYFRNINQLQPTSVSLLLFKHKFEFSKIVETPSVLIGRPRAFFRERCLITAPFSLGATFLRPEFKVHCVIPA